MRATKEATYSIVSTLNKAMRIVDGAQPKCRVSYELRKKTKVGLICVQFKRR